MSVSRVEAGIETARLGIPPQEKDLITYAEAEALGYGSERKLRELIRTGKLKRSVLEIGRSIRFERRVLIDELRNGG